MAELQVIAKSSITHKDGFSAKPPSVWLSFSKDLEFGSKSPARQHPDSLESALKKSGKRLVSNFTLSKNNMLDVVWLRCSLCCSRADSTSVSSALLSVQYFCLSACFGVNAVICCRYGQMEVRSAFVEYSLLPALLKPQEPLLATAIICRLTS